MTHPLSWEQLRHGHWFCGHEKLPFVLNSIFVTLQDPKKAEKQAFLTITLVCTDRVMSEDIFAS